jgi:hypothetical protein
VDGPLKKDAGEEVAGEEDPLAVGRREEGFYRALMPSWRFWIRQKLMKRLDSEMDTLQAVQVSSMSPSSPSLAHGLSLADAV